VRAGAKAGLLVLEVAGDGMPAALVNKEGRVGVLLGLESRTLPRDFLLLEVLASEVEARGTYTRSDL